MAEERAQGNGTVASENETNGDQEPRREAQGEATQSGDRGGSDRPQGQRSGQGRPPRRQGGGRRGGYDRRFGRRLKKACQFCKEGSKGIDYKRADSLRRFITERGNIRSRRKVGNCAKHQRQLAIAIKRARHMALLPYTADHMRGQ